MRHNASEPWRAMYAPAIDPLSLLEDHAIHTVRVEWCDLHGLARGKRLSRGAFDRALEQGLRFSTAPLFMDLRGETVETRAAFARAGWPDMVARPDLTTLHIAPQEEGTASVIADLETSDGAPVEFAPRYVLRRALERVLEPHEEFVVGAELEFYVLPSGWRLAPQRMRPSRGCGACCRRWG
jgi:glutamine synthetase